MKESQFKSITFKNLNFVEKIFMKNLLVNMIWKKDFVVSSKITKSLLSEYETFLEIFEVETRRVTSLHQKKIYSICHRIWYRRISSRNSRWRF